MLLTYVVLPGARGRAIARQVVANRPSMRVLYMSGYTDDMIVQHGVLEPGLAFALARRIREVLAADSPPLVQKNLTFDRARDVGAACAFISSRRRRLGAVSERRRRW